MASERLVDFVTDAPVAKKPRVRKRVAKKSAARKAEAYAAREVMAGPAAMRATADEIARVFAADAVRTALRDSGKTLRQIQSECGIHPTLISRAATGYNPEGPRVSTLALIALALGKHLRITIE